MVSHDRDQLGDIDDGGSLFTHQRISEGPRKVFCSSRVRQHDRINPPLADWLLTSSHKKLTVKSLLFDESW